MVQAKILLPKRSDRHISATVHHTSLAHVHHDPSLPKSPDNSFAVFGCVLFFLQSSRYANKTLQVYF